MVDLWLCNGLWDRDTGELYIDGVDRWNAAYAAASSPPDRMKILWAQGESDTGNSGYATELDNVFAGFRSDMNGMTSQTPIYAIGMNKDWLITKRRGANAVVEDIPNRVPYSAFVNPVGVSSNATELGNNDKTHHGFIGLTQILPYLIIDAFPVAIANNVPTGSKNVAMAYS